MLDLKVFHYLGFHGVACLTSTTSQNTKCVKKVHSLPPEFLWDQYKILNEDISISGIKVGMVGCGKNIKAVEQILSDNPNIPKVVDPVFQSSSGTWLLEKKSIHRYIAEISGKASVLTPNLEEATLISRVQINNQEDMQEAAKCIYDSSHIPCLVKGGHLQERTVDILYDGNKFHFFKKNKIRKKVHGTGCFLSSSLLAFLAQGNSLETACLMATQLTHKAIKNAIQIGHGQYIISSFPPRQKETQKNINKIC